MEKWSIEFFMTRTIKTNSDPEEKFDEMAVLLHDQVEKYIEAHDYVRAGDESEDVFTDDEPDPIEQNADEDEVEDFDAGESEEDGDLTEEDIRTMKKADLIQLIEDEGLDTDPSEYKKVGDLREAVIEEAFGEDDPEEADEPAEDEDAPADDWGDFDSEDKPEDAADDGDLTEEDIMAMKRDELIQLIEEEDLDTDPKKYKVLSKLRKAVVAEAFGEE